MKLKQFIYVAAFFGIFALSVYFTNTISKIFRSTFEGSERIINMDVSTYKVRYNNVWEKMKIYSKDDEGDKIEKININITDENQAELIKNIKRQVRMINKISYYKVPDISADKIKSCTEYVNYGNCDANGFSFWYLIYDEEEKEKEKEKEVRMIVDTEFMTVYRISVTEAARYDIYENVGVADDKVYKAAEYEKKVMNKVKVVWSLAWSNYDEYNNLFLDFYKMTMNRMPDIDVKTDSEGAYINAVYHDDFEGEDVSVALKVSRSMPADKLVFDWGMSYFDEVIQQ